jgi:hypothetical protein
VHFDFPTREHAATFIVGLAASARGPVYLDLESLGKLKQGVRIVLR